MTSPDEFAGTGVTVTGAHEDGHPAPPGAVR
jgi:hypothetical protein